MIIPDLTFPDPDLYLSELVQNLRLHELKPSVHPFLPLLVPYNQVGKYRHLHSGNTDGTSAILHHQTPGAVY